MFVIYFTIIQASSLRTLITEIVDICHMSASLYRLSYFGGTTPIFAGAKITVLPWQVASRSIFSQAELMVLFLIVLARWRHRQPHKKTATIMLGHVPKALVFFIKSIYFYFFCNSRIVLKNFSQN